MGEKCFIGLNFIRDTCEKVDLIRKRLLTTQSRHKSYTDRRGRLLEFEVGDHVFLKVMPKRGVVGFGKQGKLSTRYIGPFEIFEKWVQLRIGWCYHQAFQVFMRYSISPCSGNTLQIRLT